jgi:2-succinyl-5-enolpyruvyl-6-hydroxy-3-cyclohexene-1-carboxylate synthase
VDWLTAHRPDRVVVMGRPTLSRPVSALLADPAVRVETVPASPRWADAGRNSAAVARCVTPGPGPGEWAAGWHDAAARVGRAIDEVLDATPELTAARLARDTVAALPAGALLVLGSSTPVRDVDRLATPRADLTMLANRGVAGIDGTISTAIGAALVHGGPAFTLMGDLTFLHDLTGLLVGEGEPAPDLTVVVPDNDGGGIFAQLEPGEDRHARDYRRVFGTPHGRDLAALAQSLGWAATRITAPGDLGPALALGGPRVVVVGTDQRAEAVLAAGLRRAAVAALA